MNSIISIFKKAIEKSGIKPEMISVPSDLPFKPESIKTLGVDYFQTTRGRAIAFGTGLKLANPGLKIMPVVGDLMTLGGNHFVHAGRRNMELCVICINNFIYKKIDNKPVPFSKQFFSPYSTFEEPFNFPHLGNSCGAVYTARWTLLHTDQLIDAIAQALNKNGLAMVEIIAPGPNYYRSIEEVEGEVLQFYYEHSVVKENEDPRNVEINPQQKIIVGNFTDKPRPTFIDSYNSQLSKVLGDKFIPHGAQSVFSKTGGGND